MCGLESQQGAGNEPQPLSSQLQATLGRILCGSTGMGHESADRDGGTAALGARSA